MKCNRRRLNMFQDERLLKLTFVSDALFPPCSADGYWCRARVLRLATLFPAAVRRHTTAEWLDKVCSSEAACHTRNGQHRCCPHPVEARHDFAKANSKNRQNANIFNLNFGQTNLKLSHEGIIQLRKRTDEESKRNYFFFVQLSSVAGSSHPLPFWFCSSSSSSIGGSGKQLPRRCG